MEAEGSPKFAALSTSEDMSNLRPHPAPPTPDRHF